MVIQKIIMEDDDDIEALRLAALQTIRPRVINKRNITTIPLHRQIEKVRNGPFIRAVNNPNLIAIVPSELPPVKKEPPSKSKALTVQKSSPQKSFIEKNNIQESSEKKENIQEDHPIAEESSIDNSDDKKENRVDRTSMYDLEEDVLDFEAESVGCSEEDLLKLHDSDSDSLEKLMECIEKELSTPQVQPKVHSRLKTKPVTNSSKHPDLNAKNKFSENSTSKQKAAPTVTLSANHKSPTRNNHLTKQNSPLKIENPKINQKASAYEKVSSPSRRKYSPPKQHLKQNSPIHRLHSPRRSPIRKRSPSPPRKRSITPRKRSITPRKRSRTPHKRSLSPRRRSPSLRKRSLSPRKRSLTPLRKRSLTPHKRSRTPRKRSITPRKRSLTPRKRSLTPRKRSITPRKRSLSPRKRSLTPRKRSHSPRRRSITPRKRSLTPRKRSLSPRKRSLSPRKRSLSPRRRSITPRRLTMRRRSISPRRRSPRRRSISQHRLSPRRRSISPWRRSQSPRRSPRRRSPTPKKRSLTPRKRSVTPKKRSPSPRKRSPSPRKRSSSPRKRSPSPRKRSLSPRHNSPGKRKRALSPGNTKQTRRLTPLGNRRQWIRTKSANTSTRQSSNSKTGYSNRSNNMKTLKEEDKGSSRGTSREIKSKEKVPEVDAKIEQTEKNGEIQTQPLDPKLEARKRKFENNYVVESVNKKIRLKWEKDLERENVCFEGDSGQETHQRTRVKRKQIVLDEKKVNKEAKAKETLAPKPAINSKKSPDHEKSKKSDEEDMIVKKKVRDNTKDELNAKKGVDLRTELSRRRAERLKGAPIDPMARIVQSALEGAVGKIKSKSRTSTPSDSETPMSSEKKSKPKGRRVHVVENVHGRKSSKLDDKKNDGGDKNIGLAMRYRSSSPVRMSGRSILRRNQV